MFSKIESLIGIIDYNCIFSQTTFFKVIQNTANILIHRLDTGQIITHVSLVFPADQLLT